MKENSFVYLLIIAAAFLLYGNSIPNGYSLDDHLVNHRNHLTQNGIKGIPEIFTSYSFNEKNLSYSYRPVLLASFAIEYSLFGTGPHVSHFISLCLYIIFSLLLFRFLQIAFPDTKFLIILFPVLFFLVHPVHTEVIDNIKSRDELLANVFGLAMLIQYIKFWADRRVFRIFLCLLLFTLGYFSKQSVFYYLALLPFLHIFNLVTQKNGNNRNTMLFASLVVVSLVVVVSSAKNFLLPGHGSGRSYLFFENPLVGYSFWERIPTGLSVSLFNLKLLVWPFVLSYYYGYAQIPLHSWGNVLPYISLFLHLALMIILFRNFRVNKLISLGIVIYFINISAVSNVFILLPGLTAERFLFFASIGQSIIFGYLLFFFLEKMKWVNEQGKFRGLTLKSGAAFLIIMAVFSAKVYSRNKVWADEYTLISSDVKHLSLSAKANDMMAFQLLGKIKSEKNMKLREYYSEEVKKHCRQCLYIYPAHITCWNNLGTLYYAKQDLLKAEICFKKAMEIDSSDANPLFNIANIFAARNQVDDANRYYQKAIANNPDILDLIPVYKNFVLKNKLIPDAIFFINEIIGRNHHHHYLLHLLLVDLYNADGDMNNVLVFLKKAYELKPSPEIAGYIEKLSKLAN